MVLDWNYDDTTDRGPSKWPRLFGAGQRQSPIDIRTTTSATSELTCCQGRLLAHDAEQGLSGLKLASSPPNRRHHHHRRHLDSIGEDNNNNNQDPINTNSPSPDDGEWTKDLHERSGSALSDSSGAPASPSPDQLTRAWAGTGGTDPMHKHKHQHQQNTRYLISKRKLFLGYPRFLAQVELVNTGHAWQVNIPAAIGQHTLLSGPPFGDRHFRLAQFHCHWGRDCQSGSEHTINGVAYAAEIHFVHWNCSRYQSFEEASKQPDGLAVLAVLVQALEGDQNRNRHLERVVHELRRVRQAKASAQVELGLDLKRLFPANRWRFATYEGSLTTPPLSEVVHWLVFLNPIECSSSQVDQFRRLTCGDEQKDSHLFHNCRPIQTTNGRLVSIWSHH